MGAAVDEVKSLFAVKFFEVVMRAMITRLDPKQSLEYHKPDSLEDTPSTRDVNTFLKENKMEGLMSAEADEDERRRLFNKLFNQRDIP